MPFLTFSSPAFSDHAFFTIPCFPGLTFSFPPYQISSHAVFELASKLCWFCTQMRVWPTSGGSVGRSETENLNFSSPTFECNDFTGRVHDGWIGWDRSSDGVGCVVEVYNDNLCSLSNLLTYADKLVRLHRQRAEPDVGGIDAKVLQLSHRYSNNAQRLMMDEVKFNVTFDTKQVIWGISLHAINCTDIDNQAHNNRGKINQKSSTNPRTSRTSYGKHSKHKTT